MFALKFKFSLFAILCVMLISMSAKAEGNDNPKRVLSVGGDITEIIYALGKGDKVVGVDITSYYPPEVNKLPKIGYKRTLSAEGLLSLKPDLIIIPKDAGPESVISQVKDSSVDVLKLESEYSFDGIKNKISLVAEKIDRSEEAIKLIKSLEDKYRSLNDKKEDQGDKKTAIFILSHAGGRELVAGTKTSAESFLEIVGLKNLVTQFESYKPLNPESIIKLDPDYLIVSSTPGATKEDIVENLLSKPAISQTKAGKEKNIIFVDPIESTGFGTRTIDAAIEINKSIYGN